MSLLMDALRRAETSKQEAARSLSGKEPPGEALSLEPLTTPASRPATTPLPDLAAHIDAVDAELATSAAPPTNPPTASGSSGQAERAAVRNAFAAKLAAPPPSRRPLWLALGSLGVAALGIAAYVGWQVTHLGNNGLAPLPAAAPMVPTVATSPQAAAEIAPPAPPPAAPSPAVATEPTSVAPPPAPRSPPARPPTPRDTPVRLNRTLPQVDPNQMRGYANFQRNELDLARQDYEQALRRDPHSTDVLLALGTIAQRQGRTGDAEQYFQRALVANPNDAAVQAAVLGGSAAGSDPQNTESRLKSLLAAQPESAPLNFALGNLYSRQSRWPEAQQAYFNAVAAEGDNPDYLFNLAVSLDHLRQGRLAAQHYRLALEAGEKRPAAFDRVAASKRLSQLQP